MRQPWKKVSGSPAQWGRWQAENPPDHVVTLTYAKVPDHLQDVLKDFDRYIRWLEQAVGRKVGFFGAIERGERNARFHVHGGLRGTSQATLESVRLAWPHGFSSVDVFRPSSGGLEYIAKTLASGSGILLLRSETPTCRQPRRHRQNR
jgi:hypothetical protein